MIDNGTSYRPWVAILLVPSLLATVVGVVLYTALRFDLFYLAPPRTLGDAIMRGSDESVLRLLSEGADANLSVTFQHPQLNGARAFQATPLTIAASRGNLTDVRLILEAGADPVAGATNRRCALPSRSGTETSRITLLKRGLTPTRSPSAMAGCDHLYELPSTRGSTILQRA